MERVQVMFWYKILRVPFCVPYVSLCLETGQPRLEALAWIRFFKTLGKDLLLINSGHFAPDAAFRTGISYRFSPVCPKNKINRAITGSVGLITPNPCAENTQIQASGHGEASSL